MGKNHLCPTCQYPNCERPPDDTRVIQDWRGVAHDVLLCREHWLVIDTWKLTPRMKRRGRWFVRRCHDCHRPTDLEFKPYKWGSLRGPTAAQRRLKGTSRLEDFSEGDDLDG